MDHSTKESRSHVSHAISAINHAPNPFFPPSCSIATNLRSTGLTSNDLVYLHALSISGKKHSVLGAPCIAEESPASPTVASAQLRHNVRRHGVLVGDRSGLVLRILVVQKLLNAFGVNGRNPGCSTLSFQPVTFKPSPQARFF